jgi:hypothetical protein
MAIIKADRIKKYNERRLKVLKNYIVQKEDNGFYKHGTLMEAEKEAKRLVVKEDKTFLVYELVRAHKPVSKTREIKIKETMPQKAQRGLVEAISEYNNKNNV